MEDGRQSSPSDSDGALRDVLEALRVRTGFRGEAYRADFLTRVLDLRIAQLGLPDWAAYLEHLRREDHEPQRLVASFAIKCTRFFRDEASWHCLDELLGRRLAHDRDAPLRAWSAGCATGEEAYSLAMLLARHMGTQASAAWSIHATDIDALALHRARTGQYEERALRHVPAPLQRSCFRSVGTHYRVRPGLRRRVVVARHDLQAGAPFAELDLIVCRNTLIYFAPDVQRRLLTSFHRALREGGLLFLGDYEGVSDPRTGLSRERRAHPIYRKRAAAPSP